MSFSFGRSGGSRATCGRPPFGFLRLRRMRLRMRGATGRLSIPRRPGFMELPVPSAVADLRPALAVGGSRSTQQCRQDNATSRTEPNHEGPPAEVPP